MIRYGIYHMFVPAYSASQILCFCFDCGIRVASKSSVESIPFPIWCSHISMGVLILLDRRDCHVNPFQPTCSSSSGSDHFQERQDHLSVFPTLFVSSIPKLPLFSHPPTLGSSMTWISLSSIHLIDARPLHSFFVQCSYPMILMKILTEPQGHHP